MEGLYKNKIKHTFNHNITPFSFIYIKKADKNPLSEFLSAYHAKRQGESKYTSCEYMIPISMSNR
jgi:hypothetical protein